MTTDDAQRPPRPWWRLTRRGLLQGLGLALVEAQLPACVPGPTPLEKTRSVELLRPEDRLWLRFDFYNLDLDASPPSGAPRLTRTRPGDAFVVVVFPPQVVGEQALFVNRVNGVDVLNEVMPSRQVGLQARLAGESRLAFRVPDAVTTIPYTADGLLDWTALEPSLVPVVTGPTLFRGTPRHRAPLPTETALELPWWLVLSPLPDAGWAHATAPVTHGGRTELWHTRLGRAGAGGVDESGSSGLRAVWTKDPNLPAWLLGTPPPDPDAITEGRPFRMAATPRDRLAALRNTSDWSRVGGAGLLVKVLGFRPEPFTARKLHLTALGATADLDGAWSPPQDFGALVAWAQRLTGGRDGFVQIVNRGVLYPFGHACVEVVVTERALRADTGTRGAYLLQRQFLVVTERRRRYPGAPGLPHQGRAFPFREVEVVTRQTPDFAGRRKLVAGDPTVKAYQPMVDAPATSEPLQLDCVGTDWAGRATPFRTPFAFVSDEGGLAFDPARMGAVAADFSSDVIVPRAQRTARFPGSQVAFAPEGVPDDTSLELHELVLGARSVVDGVQQAALTAAQQVAGFPSMVEALVELPAMQALAGAKALGSRLAFIDEYLQQGFGQGNPGEAFLQFVQPKLLEAATDATGGLVTPNQALTAITRTLGPVGGQVADALADTYSPQQVFDQFGKLLGGVPLKDIVQAVQGVKGKVDEALKWVEQKRPTEVVASFRWKPRLQRDPLGLFNPTPETVAVFEGEARQSLTDTSARSAKASGELTNFQLKLLGDAAHFLTLDVAAVRFRAGTGQKTTLDVQLKRITFAGALSFVEALRPFLEALGQGPSSLPIPQGIEVTAGLQIPKVQVGVFQLANLGFDAKLVVPFTGAPARFRFRFASRENPFTVSVAVFGGTGYFGLGVGGDGIELVEIAFEFGGMLALDVGIASGSIKAVAGIYLKVEKQQGSDRVELSGYLKLTGQLQVLGLVSVSILLDLSFQYLRKPALPAPLDIVTGRAKCEIKVTIVFFTIAVGFEVEKSFGGNPADPTVADQFSLPDWQEYAAAFA